MTAKRLLNPQGSIVGQEESHSRSSVKQWRFSSPTSCNKTRLVRLTYLNSHKLHPSMKPDTQKTIKKHLREQRNRIIDNCDQQKLRSVDSEQDYIKHLQTILSVMEETHALSVILRDKNRRQYHQSLTSIYRVRDNLKDRQKQLLEKLQQLQQVIDSNRGNTLQR